MIKKCHYNVILWGGFGSTKCDPNLTSHLRRFFAGLWLYFYSFFSLKNFDPYDNYAACCVPLKYVSKAFTQLAKNYQMYGNTVCILGNGPWRFSKGGTNVTFSSFHIT